MRAWYRKLALLALLTVLPLQGIAATLSALACFLAEKHQAAESHIHSDQGGSFHEHDGDPGENQSGHLGCHHFFSAMPTVVTMTTPSEVPAFESTLSLLFTLFFPEQPQRPPRA